VCVCVFIYTCVACVCVCVCVNVCVYQVSEEEGPGNVMEAPVVRRLLKGQQTFTQGAAF